jgi:hypothetical protein
MPKYGTGDFIFKLVEMAVGLHSGPSLALPLRAPEAVQIVPYDLWNPEL